MKFNLLLLSALRAEMWWWLFVFLGRTMAATPEQQKLFDEIRAHLGTAEKALEKHAWSQALVAYEDALEMMNVHSLSINDSAETQLFNNAGWAAFQLGEYDRALTLYGLGARSCETALIDQSFRNSRCIDKIYENLHQLLHLDMKQPRRAIEWLKEGVAASERVADALGMVGEAKMEMGQVVAVRLGYCLVLDHQDSAAEELLAPFISQNTSYEWRTDAFRRPLIQEAATYLGWSRKNRRDWIGASRAFATAARLALPVDDETCAWRVQEGWLDDENVTVWPLPTRAPFRPTSGGDRSSRSPTLPPWCIARGTRGSQTCSAFSDSLDGWTRRQEIADDVARVKLVELNNIYVSGEEGSAVWRPFPHCVFYTGDHTASSSPPTDWGVEAVMAESEGPRTVAIARKDTDSLVRSPEIDASKSGVAVLLFDMRDGHKVFWHHQTETITRLSIVLARLFDSDASPAADLPSSVREKLDTAKIIYPSTLEPTITALLKRRHRTLLSLRERNRLEAYRWRPGVVHFFTSAFVVEWPPAEPRPAFEKKDGFREYSESLFRLHFVPAPLLELQVALQRQAFPPAANKKKPYALFYSRGDTDQQHFASEMGVMARMKKRLESVQVVAWRGDAADIESAAQEWSRAAIVVGPQGSGLANLVHCAPGTPVVIFPLADNVGSPSAWDEYLVHLAKSLDLRLLFVVMEEVGPILSSEGDRRKGGHAGPFGNYSEVPERDQDFLVDVVRTLLLAPNDVGKIEDALSTTAKTFNVGEHPPPRLTLYRYY